ENGSLQTLSVPNLHPDQWAIHDVNVTGINSAGVIVGTAGISYLGIVDPYAVTWNSGDPGTLLDSQPLSQAYAVNGSGVIVGSDGTAVAASWQPGDSKPTFLLNNGNTSWATGINASEQIVGNQIKLVNSFPIPRFETRPFIIMNGTVTD